MGTAKELFSRPRGLASLGNWFDVAADGRFLVVEPVGGETTQPSIQVVQNWFARSSAEAAGS